MNPAKKTPNCFLKSIQSPLLKQFSVPFLIVILLSPGIIPNVFGFTLGNATSISNSPADNSASPEIATSNSNAYIVWKDLSQGQVFFSRSTDYGKNFGIPISISGSTFSSQVFPAFNPQIAAIGNNVYVTWSELGKIYFTESSNNGTSFSTPANISRSAAQSVNPQISATNNDVYIVWQEGTGSGSLIYFAARHTGGSFTSPTLLSNTPSLDSKTPSVSALGSIANVVWYAFDSKVRFVGNAYHSAIQYVGPGYSASPPFAVDLSEHSANVPRMFLSNSGVYISWEDDLQSDAYFSWQAAGNSTFSLPRDISKDGKVFSPSTDLYGVEQTAFVLYCDSTGTSTNVYFSRTLDGGKNFSTPLSLSKSAVQNNFSPRIQVTGGVIYAVWYQTPANDPFLATSTDNGTSFSNPLDISNSAGVPFNAFQVSQIGNGIQVVWEDNSGGSYAVRTRTISNTGSPSISIESVSNRNPRWGIDSTTISGAVNANASDIISINWGDGTLSSLPVNGTGWGPISHVYNITNTGARIINAILENQTFFPKANASAQISVAKHRTALLLNPVASVIEGQNVSLSGVLLDVENSSPLDGKQITFSGSGAPSNALLALTNAGGQFNTSAKSPSLVSDYPLNIKANFTGDLSFAGSSSNDAFFNTVAPSTLHFNIPPGSPTPTVELSGFNATLSFTHLASTGSVFVSNCTAPASSRYSSIYTRCIRLSPAIALPNTTSALLTLSYDDAGSYGSQLSSSCDIFQVGANLTTDITEGRNQTGRQVTGFGTGLGKYVLGSAVRSETPVGAVDQQIFINKINSLTFNFTQKRSLSLDNNTVQEGHAAFLTVVDPYSNYSPSEFDNVSVNVTSSSDPRGIAVSINETGINTGVFRGFFIPSTTTSEKDSTIRVSPGDVVDVRYSTSNKTPLKVWISGVKESGIARASSFLPPEVFSWVGDSYQLQLADAKLAPGANVTIKMSYSNVPSTLLSGVKLRLFLVNNTFCVTDTDNPNGSGWNSTARTIEGTANTTGQFMIGVVSFDAYSCSALPSGHGGGGGGGGGLPRPGTGVVLDSVGSVAAPAPVNQVVSSGGGSSSALISSTGSVSSSSQAASPVRVITEPPNITLDQIPVRPHPVQDYSYLFERVVPGASGDRAITVVGGSTYFTGTTVYDIGASGATLQGNIIVTVQYDRSLVNNTSRVRLLHYNGTAWEDVTTSIDTAGSTVTGTLKSLSPVVVAESSDDTFDSEYFAIHPQDRILIQNMTGPALSGPPSLSWHVDSGMYKVDLSAELKNQQRAAQEYSVIVGIYDKSGVAQDFAERKGMLSRDQMTNVSIPIEIPESVQECQLQLFIVGNADSLPVVLSQVSTLSIRTG